MNTYIVGFRDGSAVYIGATTAPEAKELARPMGKPVSCTLVSEASA